MSNYFTSIAGKVENKYPPLLLFPLLYLLLLTRFLFIDILPYKNYFLGHIMAKILQYYLFC